MTFLVPAALILTLGHAPGPAPTLREAIARQHLSFQIAPANALQTWRASKHRNSTATKITAGFAMGFAGLLAGTLIAFDVASVAKIPGSNQSTMYTGAIVGGGAGAALGVWLASR